MEKTPSRPKFSHRRINIPTGTSIYGSELEENIFIGNTESNESPVHIACTQEGFNNADVVWNWNSPKAKPQAKSKKNILTTQSPKIPLTRQPSNNQIENFEKLHKEMQCLKEAISVPDNEESLILSPLEEEDYKNVKHTENMGIPYMPLHENYPTPQDDDLFNDIADEDLVLCSQRIETELEKLKTKKNLFCNNNDKLANVKDTTDIKIIPLRDCDIHGVKFTNKNFSNIENVNNNVHIGNDSLDALLKEFKDTNESFTEVIEKHNAKESTTKKFTFSRTKSENQNSISKPTTIGKVEFHRTQSFESTFEHLKEVIPQNKLEEIERKRREAIAKLEAKRKHEGSDSPLKCTPQEIEQKRLQALAKREAKRQQEIIERKRQEALKRLELSRKKNATIVKSSLCKRL